MLRGALAIRPLWLVILTSLLLGSPMLAQWQEQEFDDSDMAIDLEDALSFQKYPTYDQYVEMMQAFASDYSHICRLDTFGTSVEGRLLLALKISDHPEMEEAEAEFLYTSSMHGDEVVGIVLLLRHAKHLLEGYGTDTEITRLVDQLSIRINPVANPDGSYSADNGRSLTHASRYNADGIDLNRNFPAPITGQPDDSTGRALENRFMMTFLREHRFTLSANIHSGAEVVNYPWDHIYALHADDDWYRFISREYADEAMAVDPEYMFGWPDDGITNGAAWYLVHTGRQDYVSYYLEGREVTLELSNIKLLSSRYLEDFWDKNSRSLINYMSQCLYGIRGLVTDEESGDPLRALIQVLDHDSAYSEVHSRTVHGDFYRLINEGNYDLVASAPGYINDTIWGLEVNDYKATELAFALARDPLAGFDQMGGEFAFRLYPNPAREQLYVGLFKTGSGSWNSEMGYLPSDQVEIKVFSAHGVLVLHHKLQNAQFPLPISLTTLPKGFYIMTISSGDLVRSMGFVKQ
jgi:hypothetical protein